MDVLARIKPDMSGHHDRKRVAKRPQGLHADAFALEVGDAADPFVREQLEATDHYTGEQHDRVAGINLPDEIWRIVQGEISLAERCRYPRRHVYIADVGETLGTQQLLGHVLGSNADGRNLAQSNRSCFEGPIRG